MFKKQGDKYIYTAQENLPQNLAKIFYKKSYSESDLVDLFFETKKINVYDIKKFHLIRYLPTISDFHVLQHSGDLLVKRQAWDLISEFKLEDEARALRKAMTTPVKLLTKNSIYATLGHRGSIPIDFTSTEKSEGVYFSLSNTMYVAPQTGGISPTVVESSRIFTSYEPVRSSPTIGEDWVDFCRAYHKSAQMILKSTHHINVLQLSQTAFQELIVKAKHKDIFDLMRDQMSVFITHEFTTNNVKFDIRLLEFEKRIALAHLKLQLAKVKNLEDLLGLKNNVLNTFIIDMKILKYNQNLNKNNAKK